MGRKYWCAVLLLFAAFVLISLTIHGNIFLQMTLEITLQYIFCSVVYYSRWDRRFFLIATIYAIGFSFSYWLNQFFLTLSGLSYEEYIWNVPFYSASILTRAFMLLALAATVKQVHHPFASDEQPRVWIPVFAVFPLLTLLVLLVSYFPSPEQWIWQICLAILDLVDVVALFLLDHLERTALEREQFLIIRERARLQDENVQALSQAYGAQRKMTHDFRAHLAALADLMEHGSMEDAKKYLADLRVRTTERILLVNSHHAAVDAVLNQKGYLGKQRGVDMRFRVNNLSPLHIPAADITIVLGNLLDNAIEACAALDDPNRWVKVLITYQANSEAPVLSITVANPSSPVDIRDGVIATSKQDRMLHGFGLQNVREILQHYDAEQMISFENGLFTFYCSWPDNA